MKSNRLHHFLNVYFVKKTANMNENTRTLLSVLFLVLSIFRVALCHYTEYPPVKLLSVDSIADRYEASYSEYRTKTERCHVRNIKRVVDDH